MEGALENSPEFPATHWTLIAAASGPQRDSALSRLYRTYWTPICAQARRFGVSGNDVEDVAQDLFLHLIRSGAMERADRDRGRFRSYLLGALRNQLSHRRAHEHAQKRGGSEPALSLDELEVARLPAEAPEFDAEWARTLLGEAVRRFQCEEQHGVASAASFAVLGPSVLGEEELSCEAAASRLGITVPAVKSRLFRLRRRFHELVREEVRRTVSSEADCDDELRHLCAVLDRAAECGAPDLAPPKCLGSEFKPQKAQ